jgi:hypothetical protein
MLRLGQQSVWPASRIQRYVDNWNRQLEYHHLYIDCFAADDVFENLSLDLANVENLAIPAILYVDSRNRKQEAGSVRLQKKIERVLESGHALDWVPACGDSISRVYTSGPN